MDPLLDRLLPAPGGRARPLIAVGAAVAGAAVLLVAVLVAGGTTAGSTATLPAVRVESSTPSPTPLLVQVSGAVRRPGLVALPDGARVLDAIAAAGGPTAKADTEAVNLAARTADGQRIVVPERGAVPQPTGTSAEAGASVSLGTATAEQLETLPRIGPALAQRIIAYRTAHGGFRSIEELQQVGGIGPKTFAGLRDLVTP